MNNNRLDQRRRGPRTGAWLVAFTVVNVTLAYGLAYATFPDRGGQIHACFKTGDAEKLGGAALSV